MNRVKIELKDGKVCEGDAFNKEDFLLLQTIFRDWQELNKKVKSLGGRNLNVPDVFSEALFCIFFNAIRTNGDAYSYDCVTIDGQKGIQIKSGSIDEDCSSFGPTSTWDEIYYIDFAPNGSVDGKVNFYKLDVDFENLIVNKRKNETFKKQQTQGRRPRFSIKNKIIKPNGIEPVLTIDILNIEIDKYVKFINS